MFEKKYITQKINKGQLRVKLREKRINMKIEQIT